MRPSVFLSQQEKITYKTSSGKAVSVSDMPMDMIIVIRSVSASALPPVSVVLTMVTAARAANKRTPRRRYCFVVTYHFLYHQVNKAKCQVEVAMTKRGVMGNFCDYIHPGESCSRVKKNLLS